ncbi:MAG: glutaredoxin family protein [Chloroflexi bacterium]|nr:glutaredoxin family protein [Chloroflexota bacterium]
MVRAREVLRKLGVTYQEIDVEKDEEAARRLESWNNGFRSVPTIVIESESGISLAAEGPPEGKPRSPRGWDRGPMITEPSSGELEVFLRRHGVI